MKISLVIPTLNEAENIERLISHLMAVNAGFLQEIIVADGGSGDNTIEIAEKAGATVLRTEIPGRARQMNLGAARATGSILYFVHADTLPPDNFDQLIKNSIENGSDFGCFTVQFETNNPFLKRQAKLSRFRGILFRGGDESLFVKQELFRELKGFREDHLIMEDYELFKRLRKKGKYQIIRSPMLVSARKVHENGYFRSNLANLAVFSLYFLGAGQQTLLKIYRKFIRGTRFENPRSRKTDSTKF